MLQSFKMNESKCNSETGKKIIEELENSTENELNSTIEKEESVIEPKPTASKRSYLEVNETVDKYKSFMLKKLETKRLKSSETLSRVRDFLPLFKESTSKLLDTFKENPDDLNIENVQEDEEHIEMNLAVVSESSDSEDSDDDEVEDNDNQSTDEESDVEEDSLNNLDEINLGIKVSSSTGLKKLKLASNSNNKNNKKPMINILEDAQNHNDVQESDENGNE